MSGAALIETGGDAAPHRLGSEIAANANERVLIGKVGAIPDRDDLEDSKQHQNATSNAINR